MADEAMGVVAMRRSAGVCLYRLNPEYELYSEFVGCSIGSFGCGLVMRSTPKLKKDSSFRGVPSDSERSPLRDRPASKKNERPGA